MWPSFISVSVLKPVATDRDEAREAITGLGLPSRVRLLKRLTDHVRPATCEEDEDDTYLTFFPAFGCILAEGPKK